MNKLIVLLLSLSLFNPIVISEEYDTEQQKYNLVDQFDKVIFIDHQLNRIELGITGDHSVVKISPEKFGSKKTSTGTLAIWVMLKNRTDYDLQVEGRVIFFDEDFIPLDDVTNWGRLYLPANGLGTYKTSSMRFDAKHYIIELREGR